MKKEKLIATRKEKGLTQNQIAQLMFIEQSGYSRKESGDTPITDREWAVLAEILHCNIAQIYQPNSSEPNLDIGTSQHSAVLISTLQHLQDYIEVLKKENQELKQKILDLAS